MRWLIDVIAIVAMTWWQRVREWPPLRLVVGSGGRMRARRAQRPPKDIIAVLVSRADMAAKVRRALSWRAILRFTSTWAELEQVIAQSAPLAVVADPLADETGDPEGHLGRFSGGGRALVVLYTSLTPATTAKLLALGRQGIRHVVFHRFDDGADRFNAVIDWELEPPREPPGGHPPLQAA